MGPAGLQHHPPYQERDHVQQPLGRLPRVGYRWLGAPGRERPPHPHGGQDPDHQGVGEPEYPGSVRQADGSGEHLRSVGSLCGRGRRYLLGGVQPLRGDPDPVPHFERQEDRRDLGLLYPDRGERTGAADHPQRRGGAGAGRRPCHAGIREHLRRRAGHGPLDGDRHRRQGLLGRADL